MNSLKLLVAVNELSLKLLVAVNELSQIVSSREWTQIVALFLSKSILGVFDYLVWLGLSF